MPEPRLPNVRPEHTGAPMKIVGEKTIPFKQAKAFVAASNSEAPTHKIWNTRDGTTSQLDATGAVDTMSTWNGIDGTAFVS